MNTSNVSAQPGTSPRSLQAWMCQYTLISYFILAYAISWIVFIPYVLGEWGILDGDFTIFYVLHTFGPAVSAIVMTYVISGKEGLQRLRKRVRQWRASWLWYLFILLGIPALVMLGIIIQPGALASFNGFTPSLLANFPFALVAAFFGVGLGEETGWRGFALPHMQSRYGSLWGSLLLGVLWSCWHLPDFLTASKGGGHGIGFGIFLGNFGIFTLAVVSLSVIMTWIYNNTGKSLFIAILAHASIDTPEAAGWTALFPAVGMIGLHWALLSSFAIPAVLVVILTRGRLGYQLVREMNVLNSI